MICDVRMPDVDGITLGSRLRAMDPTVPLIFMTAYEVAPAEEEALRTLKATLLIKPVTATRIATAVCDVGQEPPPGSVDDRTALER